MININLLSNKYIYIINVYNKCNNINLDMDTLQVKVGKLKKYNKNKKYYRSTMIHLIDQVQLILMEKIMNIQKRLIRE